MCLLREYARAAYIGAATLTSMLSYAPRTVRSSITAGSIAVLLLVGSSCGGMSSSAPSKATNDPRDFFPLRAGNAWSYDVDTGESVSTLAITRVEAVDGRMATVRTAQTVVVYELSSQGIREADAGGWVLRAPLREGEAWPGRGGRSARLVSTDASAQTVAGDFDDCIEVLESGGRLELEVRTVYCRGVGPVAVASTMRSNVSERVLTVRASLRGYVVTGADASASTSPRPR